MSETLNSSEIKNPLAFGVLPPSTNADITVNLTEVISALQPLLLLPSILSDLSAISVSDAAAVSQLITANGNLGTIIGDLVPLATEATLLTRATEATLLTRATEATLLTRAADATITARLNILGQNTMAASAPVVIASDQTAIPVSGTVSVTEPVSVDDNGGSLTVDTSQLPAVLSGGRLDVIVGAALPAGTNNIGDVDVLTVPAPLSTTGGGTEATALRVTVANDSTGVLSVDDNGGSLTVDTTQLPAVLVGARLDTNIGAWLGATTPTVGQKTMAASVPVVISSDQTAVPISGTVVVTNAGTFAVQNTPAQNSGKTVNRFVLAQGVTAGTTVIAAADASNKHKIVGVLLTMNLTGTVKFIDSSGDLTGAMDVTIAGGFVIPPSADFPFIQTGAINRSISIVTTVGGANGVILYITEP